ncbi:hypothetical protein LZF95_05870 [Algoriphagus sp. AGSA1]|uniref:hypothetical protein n=1 Tax=Algoriphagus sp. AGSA1 TaxID=2907213 RepID=UPI001F1B5576|nr:hypothetical protein [Algoriphagus sp. AGSA1]MCE7054194.1 hypothetical protein [Algoriphagus sp. AGSA1]
MKKKIDNTVIQVKTIFTLVILMVSTILSAQNIEESTIQNEFRLTGDSISFPLTIVNAFPFISGEVNGVKGKFMFDTGHQGALDINNNIVPLSSERATGRGFVASGQKFEKFTNDTIKELRLVNGLHFQNLKQIPSANYDFLQNNITPDCIGYIGYDFFKGYMFKLDYTKRKLTFYKSTPERETSKDFLSGEKVLGILNFEIRNLPNIPMIKVNIDDVEMLGLFDTGGSYGLLEFTEKDTENLTTKNYLKDYGKDGYDEDLFVLSNVTVSKQLTTDFIGIHKIEESSQFKKAIGVTEDNLLILAYRFLSKYKTVWDYDHKKIYVLEY